MPPQGNSRYLELLKAVTRSLEVKLRLKALDLAATLVREAENILLTNGLMTITRVARDNYYFFFYFDVT